jgi:surface polysaccharide O-acyltransferase-like enzyme
MYFLIVWFVTNCIIGIVEIAFNITFGVDLNFFTGYIGYFVLGYYLVHFKFTPAGLKNAYLLGIAGFIVSVFMSYLFVLFKYENRAVIIESDFTPDIIFVCAALFLWFKSRRFKKDHPENPQTNIINNAVGQISKESFGIYLVHVLLIKIIFSDDTVYADFLGRIHPWLLIPLKAIIILIASFVVIKIIRLVPYLRKVAG